MFGKFAQITEIIRFLMSIKAEDIGRVIDAAKVLQSDADIKVKVASGILIAEIAATYTPTTADDEFIGWVKLLAGEDLLWKLVDLVKDLLDGKQPDSALQSLQAFGATDAKMIPIPVLLQIAMFIASLIKDWKKGS